MHMARLFRVILPVNDIDRAKVFYGALLGTEGAKVSPGRHYFGCEGVILACFNPRADGDPWDATPNPDHVYFAVPDLEGALARARAAGAVISRPIETQPWGERSFYCSDPFGNKLCFVADGTLFTAGLL
jgi:predicted enzyme related to lactoylglutathione lyase